MNDINSNATWLAVLDETAMDVIVVEHDPLAGVFCVFSWIEWQTPHAMVKCQRTAAECIYVNDPADPHYSALPALRDEYREAIEHAHAYFDIDNLATTRAMFDGSAQFMREFAEYDVLRLIADCGE